MKGMRRDQLKPKDKVRLGPNHHMYCLTKDLAMITAVALDKAFQLVTSSQEILIKCNSY